MDFFILPNQFIIINQIIMRNILKNRIQEESKQQQSDQGNLLNLLFNSSKIQKGTSSKIYKTMIEVDNFQKIQQNINLIEIEEDQILKHQIKNEEEQQVKFRKRQYYHFFDNTIPNSKNYALVLPLQNEFKQHKIKYLFGNDFHQYLQAYDQPYIRIKNIQKQGTIINYIVIISMFELEITLLNIDQDAVIQQYTIGRGSFGSVRIQAQNKRMFAVKRQMFRNKYHREEFNMMANKNEINEVIKQLAIYKICSLFKIGPAAETKIGFDLICYRDCIEFQIQYCIKIEYNSRNDSKRGIYVDKSKFEQQIKYCLFILHFHGIIHKDIKPANILFSIKYNKYVLADFGISHPVMEKIGYCSITHYEGTHQYMSDQMKRISLNQIGYVDLYGNDVYSLSVVLNKQMWNQNIQQSLEQFKQRQNIKKIKENQYEYQYLRLKYYCIKPYSKMEQVQTYWVCMNSKRRNQLIQIIDKSIEYDKIKKVYNYLSKLQEFKNIDLDSLRIQSQSIKSIKIDPNFKQNTQLKLKNTLRVYGYSEQVKEIIIKLNLQIQYKQILAKIERRLAKDNENNHRDRMLENHKNYIKKMKQQLQKYQKQQSFQQMFKRYMIILQYGNMTEQLETIVNLEKLKYKRKNEQKIEQMIRVYSIEKKKNLQKFHQLMKGDQIQKIIKQKKLYQQIAMIYQQIDNYQAMLIYYNKCLNMFTSDFGQQHPKVATTYHNIALVYHKMSKYETALIYYNKCLKMDILFHGQKHLNVVITYNNIGLVYHSIGEDDAALRLLTKSLNIARSFYGQQHPNIAIALVGIACVYDSLAKYETALAYYIKSLGIFILFYGRQHPYISKTFKGIGDVYKSMGKYETALIYFNKCLKIDISIHGYEHLAVASDYNRIASVCNILGKYEEALTYYNKSLNMFISFHGQQHLDVANTYNNIGLVYDNLGKYDTALINYTKGLDINILLYGQKYPCIANGYNNISTVYQSMGKYETALIYITKSLNLDISYYGQQHPNVARSYNNIGTIYKDMGNYETALKYITKSFNIDISYYSQQHPNIATSYYNIGEIYAEMGQYETAFLNFNKGINIFISFYGQQHPIIARGYQNIATIYSQMSQPNTSLEYNTKSEKILLKFYKQNHPSVAKLYQSISINYFEMSNRIQAQKYIKKSMKLLIDLSMVNSPMIANNYHLLSNIFIKKNKYSKSLYYAYFALDTFLSFNPLDHPKSPNYISLLARIYYQMDRFIQSYFFYRLSCQILVRYFPIHHTNVRNAKHMMNEMEWSMPQSTHNYTSNIEFVDNINSKYSQLPKHKLIKVLFAKKWQLKFEQQHRSRRDSVEYLKCVIELYLCYKYLGYLKEQKKIGDSVKEELSRFEQSQQKSMFKEFIQEISIE